MYIKTHNHFTWQNNILSDHFFKIKYPKINSSWNFTKYPDILQKVHSLLYQLYMYMMLFFSFKATR